ncbi:uncharacterized protein LOC126316446 [Schistocerca gregaria]|uniref:uncharacterized protein LOC126316446 n=1 Tax=Schistocerca gregaria TaxID=7010 RepID=UPI00211EAF60|nr:uncharacterized protein LOC126316446 [Schistocerca gregaria]
MHLWVSYFLWNALKTMGVRFATAAAAAAVGPRLVGALLRRFGRPFRRSCNAALYKVLGNRLDTFSGPTVFALSQKQLKKQTVRLLVFLAKTSENTFRYLVVDMAIFGSAELLRKACQAMFTKDQDVKQKPSCWEIYDNYTPRNQCGHFPRELPIATDVDETQSLAVPTEPLEDSRILELIGQSSVYVECTREELEEILAQDNTWTSGEPLATSVDYPCLAQSLSDELDMDFCQLGLSKDDLSLSPLPTSSPPLPDLPS